MPGKLLKIKKGVIEPLVSGAPGQPVSQGAQPVGQGQPIRQSGQPGQAGSHIPQKPAGMNSNNGQVITTNMPSSATNIPQGPPDSSPKKHFVPPSGYFPERDWVGKPKNPMTQQDSRTVQEW